MKAYRLVYVFTENEIKGQIEYKEDLKQEHAPAGEVKQVLDCCLISIKNHYANYSEEYNGYFCMFSFTKLDSGSYCIYKLDGKEGKFTVSILVIRDGYLPFYPIQLYGSDIFNFDSSKSDKGYGLVLSEEVSSKLKAVEGIGFEKSSLFLKGRGDHILRNILDGILDTGEDSALIKILDRLDNIIIWITAIQMAFPKEVAHSVYFSIEASNSDLTECILTTSQDSLKSLEGIEGVEIYSFNFILGRISKAINEFRLTRLIEMGYIISAETINAFHRFLIKFNYKKVDRELEKCYKLFNMINFGLGNTEAEDVESALEFAYLYGSQPVIEEIFEGIQSILNKIEYELDMERVKVLSDFMYKTAVKSKEKIYLDKANDFFFRHADEIVMKSSLLDEEGLLAFYDDVKKLASRHVDRIIKQSISPIRLKQIGEYLGSDTHPLQSEYFMTMILQDLIAAKYSWNRAMHIEGFGEFVNACIKSLDDKANYKQILETVSRDVDCFSNISLLLYNKLLSSGYTEDFVMEFSKSLLGKPCSWAEDVRSAVYELDIKTRLLFEEFAVNLKESPNRPDYFWNSFKHGQKDTPGYLRSYTGEAVKIYLTLLDEKELSLECERLIGFIIENNIILDREILKNLIKDYENTLELVEPSEGKYNLIQSVDRMKKENYISTLPDISGLIIFAMWIANPGGGHRLRLKDVLEDCPDLKRMEQRYFQYLLWCLPNIIEYAEVSDEHKLIIDQFCRAGEEEEFFKLYIETIKKRCVQNKSSGYSKVLNFLFSYYFYMLPTYVYMGQGQLIEDINLKISELLEGDYIRNINDLDKDLTYEFEKRELSVPVMWKDMYKKSRENRSSPLFKNVIKMFTKGRS